MDGRERWRVTTNASEVQDKTIMNRIMLRFRPIAPKPVSGDSSAGGLLADNNNAAVNRKRVKRKYVRVCKNNKQKREQKLLSNDQERDRSPVDTTSNNVVTLQLLPEKSDLKESSVERPWFDLNRMVTIKRDDNDNYQEQDIGFDNAKNFFVSEDAMALGASDRTVVMSWVIVESVKDTCTEGGELGSTDVERVTNLERDTCPGFISDGLDRVVWVNQAYNRMVMDSGGGDGDGGKGQLTVRLVVKEKIQCVSPAFTCRVKLQYTWQKDRNCSKLTVPCDAWRMDFGGFAWRLDVKAALSLGL